MNSEPKSLSDKITEELREKIIYGKYKQGDIITVRDIAKFYNVSITPVRDAVNRLVQIDLLKVIPYKGYIVSQINIKELNDLFTVRIILECSVVKLLTEKSLTEKQIKEMELLVPNIDEDTDDDDVTVFMRENHTFHVGLAKITNNDYLTQILNDTIEKMQRFLYIDSQQSDLTTMREEHLSIINLIKRGDAIEARELIISHIEGSKRRVYGEN